MSRALQALSWLPELLWATLLWWLGCLAGAGLLGVGPATLTLSSLARNRQCCGDAISWTQFWQGYRASWAQANQLLLPGLLLLGISAFNFLSSSSAAAQWIFLAGMILSAAVVAWLAPLAVYYDISIRRCWWVALSLVVRRPLPTALLVLFTAAAALVSYLSLILTFTLVPAAWICLVTAVSVRTFDENEARLRGDDTPQLPLPRNPVSMH